MRERSRERVCKCERGGSVVDPQYDPHNNGLTKGIECEELRSGKFDTKRFSPQSNPIK